MTENKKVIAMEMQRIYSSLDRALSEWVKNQPFQRQVLLTLVYIDQIESEENRMWQPSNLRKIGFFYWDKDFPRDLYDQMVEAYVVSIAAQIREDMIPPPPEEE